MDVPPHDIALEDSSPRGAGPQFRKRFRLFFLVIAMVVALSLVKLGIHWFKLEFLALNALYTSAIAAAVFIIGFLLSSVLADYKESEKLPAEIRVAMESLRDDARGFAALNGAYSAGPMETALRDMLSALTAALKAKGHDDLRPAIQQIDELAACVVEMERAGMAPNYVVRLKAELGSLRRSLFRLYHIQKIEFVPSVHILVQTLVAAIVMLLLFLKTEGSPESALIFGFIAYMFIYALHLISALEQPFRKGGGSLDDVSLFLLRGFSDKLEIAVPCERDKPTSPAR